jgi:hypothetical protein
MAYGLCKGIFRKGLKMGLVHGILAREGVMKCLLRVTGGHTYASRRSSVAYKGKHVGLGSGTISLSSPHSVLPHVIGFAPGIIIAMWSGMGRTARGAVRPEER